MSLSFSDSANKDGIVELIDANCHTNSVSYPLIDKVRDINLAFDKVLALIFQCGGQWQFDDYNHADYPIITTNLVASQRDYSFTTDENGYLILDIYKVMAKDPSGVYQNLTPKDMQSDKNVDTFNDGKNTTGTPIQYDKTANGIFLDPVPSYNSSAGLKIFINREATYFTSADTTKKPGFAGIFHEYLALRPSYFYCLRNSKPNAKVFQEAMLIMEQDLKKYYGSRERDIKRRMTANVESMK